VMAQFGRTSTVAGAPPGCAPAPKITSAATVQARGLLQAINRCEGLRCSSSTVVGGNGEGGSVWGQNTWGGPLFIGGFDLFIAKVDSGRILALTDSNP
jgi:hypothetical protein